MNSYPWELCQHTHGHFANLRSPLASLFVTSATKRCFALVGQPWPKPLRLDPVGAGFPSLVGPFLAPWLYEVSKRAQSTRQSLHDCSKHSKSVRITWNKNEEDYLLHKISSRKKILIKPGKSKWKKSSLPISMVPHHHCPRSKMPRSKLVMARPQKTSRRGLLLLVHLHHPLLPVLCPMGKGLHGQRSWPNLHKP